jgi:hypothetical protein
MTTSHTVVPVNAPLPNPLPLRGEGAIS